VSGPVSGEEWTQVELDQRREKKVKGGKGEKCSGGETKHTNEPDGGNADNKEVFGDHYQKKRKPHNGGRGRYYDLTYTLRKKRRRTYWGKQKRPFLYEATGKT